MSIIDERARMHRAWYANRMMDLILYGERSDGRTLPGVLSPAVPAVPVSNPFEITEAMLWDAQGYPIRKEKDYLGGPALVADGWRMELIVLTGTTRIVHIWWVRGPDDVKLDHRDVRRGKWCMRPPTNRRRKRERAKARRRERLRG